MAVVGPVDLLLMVVVELVVHRLMAVAVLANPGKGEI
jgi:hypothetical protein